MKDEIRKVSDWVSRIKESVKDDPLSMAVANDALQLIFWAIVNIDDLMSMSEENAIEKLESKWITYLKSDEYFKRIVFSEGYTELDIPELACCDEIRELLEKLMSVMSRN